MARKSLGNVEDVLPDGFRSERDSGSVGAVKAGPAQKVRNADKVSGVNMASQSFSQPSRPSINTERGKNSPWYKGKPGAR